MSAICKLGIIPSALDIKLKKFEKAPMQHEYLEKRYEQQFGAHHRARLQVLENNDDDLDEFDDIKENEDFLHPRRIRRVSIHQIDRAHYLVFFPSFLFLKNRL